MRKSQEGLSWGPLVILLAATVGCSSRASVTGNVTLDGQPIDGGTISFIPTDNANGSTARGKIEGGHYSIPASEGLTPGTKRIKVRWTRKAGKKVRAPRPEFQDKIIEQVMEVVPPRYNARSELKAEIKTGKNVVNFELHSQ